MTEELDLIKQSIMNIYERLAHLEQNNKTSDSNRQERTSGKHIHWCSYCEGYHQCVKKDCRLCGKGVETY